MVVRRRAAAREEAGPSPWGDLAGAGRRCRAGVVRGQPFLDALWDFPRYVAGHASTSEYDEHPTAFWIVAYLDLAVVVPATVATALGLLRGAPWAAKAYDGVVGWYALVPPSVAAMALVMLARDDPAADAGRAVVLTVAGLLGLLAGAAVFRPLLRLRAVPPHQPRDVVRAEAGGEHRRTGCRREHDRPQATQ